jgi:hypothetical protein
VKNEERGAYSVEPVKERLLVKLVWLCPTVPIGRGYFSVFVSRKEKEPFF